jgi:glycosyltransferase involved in cell wall biosynthesis
MRVFLSVASLLPGYGGPAKSVPRLARALAQKGIGVGLWSPDGSALSVAPSHMGVQPLVGPLDRAMETFGRIDILHDNGIWLAHNHRLASIAVRRAIPRVVSTRGMLEPWAMRHKRWKKRIAWTFYQRRDLASASALHVTSEAERRTVNSFGWPSIIRVIPNGVDLPEITDAASRDASRTLLFVGRLHPVKGLPMLLDAWSQVRPVGWKLRIVGPDESGHRRDLEKQVSRHEIGASVEFSGALDGSALRRAYLDAAGFVLPSHTENFGMAAAEALAHGLPVIATQGTPWQSLVDEACGWWVRGETRAFAAAIRELTELAPEARAAMGERGRTMAARQFSWDAVADSFIRLYELIR